MVLKNIRRSIVTCSIILFFSVAAQAADIIDHTGDQNCASSPENETTTAKQFTPPPASGDLEG